MDSTATTTNRNSSRNNKTAPNPHSSSSNSKVSSHSSKMSSLPSPPQFNTSDFNLSNAHLHRNDDAISQLPRAFESLLSSLSSFFYSGQQLALLLGNVLDDTPLHSVATSYQRACEDLSLKCSQQESVLCQQFAASCQAMGPLVSSLRSSVSQYKKSGMKYEALKSQFESLSSDSKSSQAKVEQMQLKYEGASNEFKHSLAQLGKANDELDSSKINVLGNCFLNLIRSHAELLSFATQALSPIAKLDGDTLINAPPVIPLNSGLVQDMTLNWLSSAQVYGNLRECGGSLSCNLISDLTHWRSNEKRRTEINNEIDALLKSYISEVSKSITSLHTVSGGFHLNPSGIALALKGCVGELECIAAGVSPLPSSKQERKDLIKGDVPRTILSIDGKVMGATNSSDFQVNVQEKLLAIEELIAKLVEPQEDDDGGRVASPVVIKECALHVLVQSCQSVISKVSKIATQLLYGRSHLVMVKESPIREEVSTVTITTKCTENGEPVISIESQAVWWLVEDNGLFLSPLSRYPPTDTFLGTVTTDYVIHINVEEFIISSYSIPLIPSLTVQCTQVNEEYLSLYQTHSSLKHHHRHHHHRKIPQDHTLTGHSSSSSHRHHRSHSSLRPASSESDGLHDDSTVTPSSGPSSRSGSGLSGQSGSGPRLYRSNSNDSMSTVTSNKTLKANQFETDVDIMNILSSKQRGGLTLNSLMVHTSSGRHRYSQNRKETGLLGTEGRRDDKDKDKSSRTSSESDSVHASSSLKFTPPSSDDFDAIYNILDQSETNPGGRGGGGGGYFEDLVRNDHEDSEREFLSGDSKLFEDSDELLQSQIISTRTDMNDETEIRRGGSMGTLSSTTPLTGSSNDSGIGVQYRNTPAGKTGRQRLSSDEPPWGVESMFGNRRLGPICQPGGGGGGVMGGGLSSDSDSETTSGRNSCDTNVMDSPDNLPGRSSSSASLRSSSRISHVDSSDTSSLPDPHEYQSFNHAPGSHRLPAHHRRQASLSSSSYGPPLSQDGNDHSRPSSFSQEMMRSQDIPMERELPYPGSSHFSNPYEHDMRGGMAGGAASHSQFLSDPYPGAPPPFMNDIHQRRMEYSRPLHPPPGPYWDAGGFTPPGHMMGPPPPPPMRGAHPPQDMYRHGNGYRATTPEISPAPSPHPTPPTTPPPHPPMMGMQPVPSPIRMPRPHPFRGPPPLRGSLHLPPPPPPHHRGMPPPPPHPPMGMIPPPPHPPRHMPPPHPHGGRGHMPPGHAPGRMNEWEYEWRS